MKITFLFGSGADSSCSSKLKSGLYFNEAVLKSSYKNTRKNLLGESCSNFTLLHKNSKKIYAQTIFYNQQLARDVFGEKIVDDCVKYYQGEKVSLNEFFNDSYNSIVNDQGDERQQKYREFYLNNMQFFDVLDEKFNSLRFLGYSNNAKRVINTYWCVYLLMLDWLYEVKDNIRNFEELLNVLDKEYDILCNENNYYQNLKNAKNCNVVTTNYTYLAEKITEKNVTYLHGKLTWFEDLKNLTVYDISEKELILNNIENIIPFVLIPSGVKPLICTKQIREFSKFIEMLNGENDDECNELCVIGYRFNSEDNHINSIVAEWLRKSGNHMTVFDYGNDIDFKKFAWSNEFVEEVINYDCEHVFLKKPTVKISRIVAEETCFLRIFKEYVKTNVDLEE